MPTEAGMMYYQRCQGILLDLDEADSSITQLTSSLQGNLLISVPRDFGLLLLHQIYPLLWLSILICILKLNLMIRKSIYYPKAMILLFVLVIWKIARWFHVK